MNLKKKHIFILAAIAVLAALFVFFGPKIRWSNDPSPQTQPPAAQKDPIWQQYDTADLHRTFVPPLVNLAQREVKKPFGIHVTPKDSPIQPEHFTGFHTGADFEIFAYELNKDVAVHAICGGKLLLKKNGTGYGGYAVQSCTLNGAAVTVLYGHLRLASITLKAGDTVTAGQQLGLLGNAFSAETDGERKHLHLSIHKGTAIVPAGYVQTSAELYQWVDPLATIQE